MKRSMVLSVVLLLTATACNGGEGEEAGRAELSVVINWTGSELDAFQAVIDDFEKQNRDISVDLVQIPFEELNAQVTQQFAAGDPPDVTVALPGLIRQLGEEDFLLPLDEQWDRWIEAGDYNESLREIASVDGTPYGAWFKGNVNALIWYRPQEMAGLGIDVPTES